MSKSFSNLDLINQCDSFPYPESQAYTESVSNAVHLKISGFENVVFGYILPSIAEILHNIDPSVWDLSKSSTPVTIYLRAGEDEPSRSRAIAKTLLEAKEKKIFEVLKGWRNELYAVYGPNGEVVLKYERAATGLFGFISYGVHMTAFTRTLSHSGAEPEIKIWVPRRSPTKSTYPGMLDQSVAGGLSAGERPWTCLIRESMEEASLPEQIAQKAVMVGAVTYFYISGKGSGGEAGCLQPECQYVYDLDLTEHPGLVLKPNDTEVEEFHLMDVQQVKAALANGEFKPNCALVIMHFLIRHGIITIDGEKDYLEIISRLHRRLPFPVGACLKDEH